MTMVNVSGRTQIGLPAEIWDQVIDHHCDSKPTLKCCSLVCKAWVYSSHRHLFRTIVVRPTLSFHQRIPPFLSSSLGVPKYVQRLVLNGQQVIEPLILKNVVTALPVLQKLVVKSCTKVLPFSPEDLGRPLTLSSLVIHDMCWDDLPPLFALFHRIQSVSLSSVSPGYQDIVVQQPELEITTIALTMVPINVLLELARGTRLASSLRSLSLTSCIYRPFQIPDMDELLHIIAPSLRHLTFILTEFRMEESSVVAPSQEDPWSSFGQCTLLERLDLLLLLVPDQEFTNYTINKFYIPMLERSTAPLQTVVLRASSPERYRPATLERGVHAILVPDDVDLLDAVFRRPNLARTRVVFDYSGAYPPLTRDQLEIVRGFLQQCLPFVAGGDRLLVTDTAYE
ncbi:hypothetical protein C8Q76DRAFT_178822 [Earliella scabrosa]|nr:hypothetical protein C8Q76DRAFT_178822 [Earliella scabrosa]